MLKDFIDTVGIEWDNDFKYLKFTNKILNRANGLVEGLRYQFALFRKHFFCLNIRIWYFTLALF